MTKRSKSSSGEEPGSDARLASAQPVGETPYALEPLKVLPGESAFSKHRATHRLQSIDASLVLRKCNHFGPISFKLKRYLRGHGFGYRRSHSEGGEHDRRRRRP